MTIFIAKNITNIEFFVVHGFDIYNFIYIITCRFISSYFYNE